MAAASAARPMSPPRATTSATSWLFPGPPTAGLQGIMPIRSGFTVTRATRTPRAAAAQAASEARVAPSHHHHVVARHPISL